MDNRYEYPITEGNIRSLLKNWRYERQNIIDSIQIIVEDGERFLYPPPAPTDGDRVQHAFNSTAQVEQMLKRLKDSNRFMDDMLGELEHKLKFLNDLFKTVQKLPPINKRAIIKIYLKGGLVKDLAEKDGVEERTVQKWLSGGIDSILETFRKSKAKNS